MKKENKPIRVALVGAGAFGRNHARVYAELQKSGEPVELAAVVDENLAQAQAVTAELKVNVPAYSTVDDLLADPANLHVSAASVAVPTHAHLKTAHMLMQGGLDVLIEKPIAPSLEEADELIATAERTGRIAMAGHLERFNPAVRATLPLLAQPMFFEVHRLSVFTPRALDVDVVLDLMIHDLDIVLWFMHSQPRPKAPIGTGVTTAYRNGKPLIRDIQAVGIPILSPKVDIANVRVEFSSGCVANFTASRVSTERVRKLRFFQRGTPGKPGYGIAGAETRQYISIDYGRRDVFALSVQPADPKANEVAPPVAGFDIALPSGMALVPSRPKIEDEEPLRAELRAFLGAVRNRTAPPITLRDGRAALALALEILNQIASHAKRAGLAR
ncbi:MAG TPA: Gfo/Idh/MocA family oxidoreductase [Terriglobales bacterium]|nr:Gfo/Idh/MocA family oxidoreductase [Terriglobales bacterium]